MSPLASLLLTLAALVVATNAEIPRYCSTALFGRMTPDYIPFATTYFPAGGGKVTIQDECQREGRGVAVGNYVVACNADSNGLAPDLRLEVPRTITPVDIVCGDQCPRGGTVAIVQYCAPY